MSRRDELQRLTKAVVKTTMPVYVGRHGGTVRAYNTLLVEHENRLREHVAECESPLQMCPECWLLYTSIGQDEYVKALTGDMD